MLWPLISYSVYRVYMIMMMKGMYDAECALGSSRAGRAIIIICNLSWNTTSPQISPNNFKFSRITIKIITIVTKVLKRDQPLNWTHISFSWELQFHFPKLIYQTNKRQILLGNYLYIALSSVKWLAGHKTMSCNKMQ